MLDFVARFGGPRPPTGPGSTGSSMESCCQCAVQLAVMMQDEFSKGDVAMSLSTAEALFDYTKGVTVEEDGRVVKSTSSGQWAVLDQGFTHGKGAWEFKLIEDSQNDECRLVYRERLRGHAWTCL